jgi:hypothetical protein
MYREITPQDINDFAKTYPNSEDEQEDLMDFWYDYKGDMSAILECIPISEPCDLIRFFQFYENEIATGEITDFIKTFKRTKKNVREIPDEKDEFEKMQKEEELLGLQQQIMLRQKQRAGANNDYFSMLEEKYGGGDKAKKGGVKKG